MLKTLGPLRAFDIFCGPKIKNVEDRHRTCYMLYLNSDKIEKCYKNSKFPLKNHKFDVVSS